MIADDEPVMKVLGVDIPIICLSIVQFAVFGMASCLVVPIVCRLAATAAPWPSRHFGAAVALWLAVVAFLCWLGRRTRVEVAAVATVLVHAVATAWVLYASIVVEYR